MIRSINIYLFGFAFILLAELSYAFGGDVSEQLVDPKISISNQASQTYIVKWQVGSADKISSDLTFKVSDKGEATVKSTTNKNVSADFYTLTQNEATKTDNAIIVTLYTADHQKLSEARYVQQVSKNGCGIALSNINVVIDKQSRINIVVSETVD